MKLRNWIVVLTATLVLVQIAEAQDHWVTTWTAAPQARLQAPLGAQRGGPAPPANAAPASFNDQTIRMIVHTSLGGRRARVTLSNAFGNSPLMIGAVHVALRSRESAIAAGSDRALAFNGKPAVTIAPGAHVISDPVDLNVPQLGDLAISIYVPGDSGQLTLHNTGLHTTYIAKGNVTAESVFNDAVTTRSYYWITGIDVAAPADNAAIVAFGDSITDGSTSTPDANRSWPSFLAERILSTPGAPKLAQAFFLANIAWTCAVPFLVFLLVSMPAGALPAILLGSLPDIARATIAGLIWYFYLARSKRVRATFGTA